MSENPFRDLRPTHETSKTTYDYQSYPWSARCEYYAFSGDRRPTEVYFSAHTNAGVRFSNLDQLCNAIAFLIHVYRQERAREEKETA